MQKLVFVFILSFLILFTTHANAAPVYIAKDSRAYHCDRNCPELKTDNVIRFNSPQKADAAGAIPCEYCNPSPVRSIDEQKLQYGNSNKVPIEQSMISSKQTPAREPGDVIELWNDALSNGDVNIARKYTSMTLYSTKYYESIVSLENLSEIYQKSKNHPIKRTIIDSKIDGDIAWVIYNVTYKDGSVKQWKDKLLLENGQWKVAPQFNVVENVKQQDKTRKSLGDIDDGEKPIQTFSIKGVKIGMTMQQVKRLFPNARDGFENVPLYDHYYEGTIVNPRLYVEMKDKSSLTVDFIKPGAYTKVPIVYKVESEKKFHSSMKSNVIIDKLEEAYGKWSDSHTQYGSVYYLIWGAKYTINSRWEHYSPQIIGGNKLYLSAKFSSDIGSWSNYKCALNLQLHSNKIQEDALAAERAKIEHQYKKEDNLDRLKFR